MTKKQIDKLMNVLFGIAAFTLILGALFKLQHYPNGQLLVYIALIAYCILSATQITRLKMIIKKLEKDSEKTQ
jgi:hypothetical protein